jgi:hypothetical protein
MWHTIQCSTSQRGRVGGGWPLDLGLPAPSAQCSAQVAAPCGGFMCTPVVIVCCP